MKINEIIDKVCNFAYVHFPWCKSLREEQDRENNKIEDSLMRSINHKRTDE